MNVKFTKETSKRAVRTFLQAFFGYVVVNIAMVDFSTFDEAFKSAIVGILVGAISAGLSALMNLEHKADGNAEEFIEDEYIDDEYVEEEV